MTRRSREADDALARAVRLSQALSAVPLGPLGDLRTVLRLGRSVSLWDIVVTYLVIYRFPLFFHEKHGVAALRAGLSLRARPYRGLAAHWRDRLMDPPRSAAGCADWPSGSRTILFPCFTRSFYPGVLRPVAEFIARRDIGRVVVLGEARGPEPERSDAPIVFQSIWDHWDHDAGAVKCEMLGNLKATRRQIFGRPQLDTIDALCSAVGDVDLRPELRWLFWREFVRLVPRIAVAEHLLLRHRPALIVSADDADQRCRIYSLLARSLGIPTLLVQQGISRVDVPEWRYMSHDAIAAMGPSSRTDMIAQGVASTAIVVTGHPGFDDLSSPHSSRSALRQDLQVRSGQKVVLLASQPPVVGAFADPRKRLEMVAALVRAAGESDRIRLVIKPHPGEPIHDLKNIVGRATDVLLVDRSRNINELIDACDVFVTFFSTSALRALYAKKPVINMDFGRDEGARSFVDSQATWVARTPEELSTHLAVLTSEQVVEAAADKADAWERFVTRTMYRADGRAASRIVDVVGELVAGPRQESALC